MRLVIRIHYVFQGDVLVSIPGVGIGLGDFQHYRFLCAGVGTGQAALAMRVIEVRLAVFNPYAAVGTHPAHTPQPMHLSVA